MISKTIFIAKDGKIFDSYEECLGYERNELVGRERDILYDEYKDVLADIQNAKSPAGFGCGNLPDAQHKVILYKKKFLDARKHTVGTKSERFYDLAMLQYYYVSSKRILANRIAEYRKLKAKLRELGKRLGFKNAKEVCDGK